MKKACKFTENRFQRKCFSLNMAKFLRTPESLFLEHSRAGSGIEQYEEII